MKNQPVASNGPRLAKLAVITGFVAGFESSQSQIDPRPEGQIELAAAHEVAQRFFCDLESVIDTQEPPSIMMDDAIRTTLKLKVSLRDNFVAKDALEKYKDDGSVAWYPPIVMSTATPKGSELADLDNQGHPSMASDEFTQQAAYIKQGEPDVLDVELYPRIDYPDGQQARVAVRQVVATADDDFSYTTTGYMDCGRLVFNGVAHTWELNPNVQKDESVITLRQTP